ncbi:MAG: four-helix bundle copper-binding protein [Bacillota bacterium]|nr:MULTISPECIES: four-helix bundle copper-binding protein [Bacillaceae]MCC2249720.1 four-helix bundle copper-binding protein [Virgibacillus sp. AGTR]WBX79402.1 four-helix bundle copper-binding protein [Virgibacillus salarius]
MYDTMFNQNHLSYQTDQSHLPYHKIIKTIQHCEAVCESTIYTILQMDSSSHRNEQLRLLRDCADICTLTAKSIARNSYFAKSIASLCAQICEVCGNHCLQHPDQQSQYCGKTCLHCAQECRNFAINM